MNVLEPRRSARGFVLMAGLVIAGLIFTSTASAQQTITYQGQLKQSGTPYTGLADLQFQLYDSLTGGAQIGPMVAREDWPVEEGLFQVDLDFGGGSFGADPRWLQITVDGDTLTPRQRVHAAPMAMFALAGNEGPPGPDGPEGPAGDSHWIINGTATAYLDGRVGIGSADPSGALDVHADSGLGFPQLRLFETQDDFARFTFGNAVSDRFWTLAALTRGDNLRQDRFNLYHSVSGDVIRIDGEGNVGLGGNPPNSIYRLNVGEGLLVTRNTGPGALAHLAISETAGPEPVRQLFWNSAAARGWRIDSAVDAAGAAGDRLTIHNTGTGDVFSLSGSHAAGVGFAEPPAALAVHGRDAWTWTSGNGRGDFHVGDGSVGLSMGVALGGGGRGVSRIWTNGGVENLFIGSADHGLTMGIQPGQVGINTGAPTAALDVDGGARIRDLAHGNLLPRSVHADSTGRLTTAGRPASKMIPPAAFTPDQDGADYSKAGWLTVFAHFGGFVAPVDLPNGATVTRMTVWFVDKSDATDLRVTLCADRLTNIASGCIPLASIETSGNVSGIRSLFDDTIEFEPEIDHDLLFHKITVSSTGPWAGANSALVAVRIDYLEH